MKKTWKRNLIAAGVLLVVCAGIYLNWYAAVSYTHRRAQRRGPDGNA